MRPASIIRTLTAAAFLASGTAFADMKDTGRPAFDNPKKDLTLFNVKFFKGAKRVIIPSAILKFTIAGKVHGQVARGSSNAHATARYGVKGYDKAYLQAVAKELRDDAAAKFKEAGWEVLTYEDIKDDPMVVEMDRMKVNPELEFPAETPGADTILVVTPTDDSNFKPAFQGMGWAFRKLAKAREAVVVVPTYQVVTPQLWAESRRGYASSEVKINTAPGITLLPNGFRFDFINHKMAGGSVANKEIYVHLNDNAGTLENVKDTSPDVANAISKGLQMLAGGGSVDRKSALYSFELNQEAYKEGVVQSAMAFNAAAVGSTAEFKPK